MNGLRITIGKVSQRILLVLALLLVSRPGFSQAEKAVAQVQALQCVSLTVADMNKAVAFYTLVLPFKKTSDIEVTGTEYEQLEGVFGLRMHIVRLRLGDETLELTEYLTPKGRPYPDDMRSNDLTFQHVAIIVRDMSAAYSQLKKQMVRYASTGPQRLPDWNKSAGGIEAFYFKDPDGHTLEILQFPPDKGPAKWHKPTKQLFLGIDHTAIVIKDTDNSLKLYRDLLGFKVAGESVNYGVEQEHLNNVMGAKLRITRLMPPAGPAIEFLEYLNPLDGKPAPVDTKGNDLWHWQTRLVVADLSAAVKALREAGYQLISSNVVRLKDGGLGFSIGATLRDSDGHELQLVSLSH